MFVKHNWADRSHVAPTRSNEDTCEIPKRQMVEIPWLNWYEENMYDLNHLRRKNPYPKMDDLIKFDPIGHTYYIEGKKVLISSASSIFEEFSPTSTDFSIIAGFTARSIRKKCIKWFDIIRAVREEGDNAIRMFQENIIERRKRHFEYKNMVHILKIGQVEEALFRLNDYTDTFMESINASTVMEGWDIGSQLGTDLHFYLESRLNQNNIGVPEIPFGVTEYEMADRFLHDHSSVEVLRTEFRVYSEKLAVIGTIDMMYCTERDKVTNEPLGVTLVDFKRTYKIKEEEHKDADYSRVKNQKMMAPLHELSPSARNQYSFQMGVYALVIEEELGIKVNDLYLIVFYEDNGEYLKIQLPYRKEMIKKALDIRLNSTI